MIDFCPNCGSMMDSNSGTCSICGYSNNVTLPYEVEAAPCLESVSAQPDIDVTTRVNPVPVVPEFDAGTYMNPVPAQPEVGATTLLNRAPAQPDIEATTRVNPAQPNNEATTRVNPVQPDIEATTRVNRAPAQPDIEATTRVNPVQPDIEATTRVNPAQPNIEATTRVNRAPASNPNGQAENSRAVPVYTPVQTPDLYEQLVAPENTSPKHAKKVVKEKNGGSVAATILLSVSLLIFLLLAVALGSVRVFGSQNVMTKTMGNVKFSELADFADKNKIIMFKTDDEILSFSEVFYENLQKGIQSYTNVEVSLKQLKKVMDKSTFTTFLGEKIAAYFSDIIDDTKDFELDEDEVSEVVMDNFDLFEKEFDISLSNRQKRELCDQLAAIIVEEDVVEAISPENIKDNNKELVSSVQIVFSWLVLILLIVISVFLLVVMIRNDLAQAGLGAGVVCTIIGGIGTLGGILAVCVPAVWEIIAGAFVGTMVCGYFAGNLPVFGGVLAVGIAGFVTKAIAGKRKA